MYNLHLHFSQLHLQSVPPRLREVGREEGREGKREKGRERGRDGGRQGGSE